jgi:hypothetical protein
MLISQIERMILIRLPESGPAKRLNMSLNEEVTNLINYMGCTKCGGKSKPKTKK